MDVIPLTNMKSPVEIHQNSDIEPLEEINMVEYSRSFNLRSGIEWQKVPLPQCHTRRHYINKTISR